MEEFEIELNDLILYGDSYEVWDEVKNRWVDIKDSCYEESFGFPSIERADGPITAITVRNNNKFLVYGLGTFTPIRDDIKYIQCESERHLLQNFLRDWSYDYPDIVTGWNIKFFDIPYLVNRIAKVLGEDSAKRLSPWNTCIKRIATMMGKDQETYNILGIGVLDYIELYRKFAPGGTSQESYKLDNICHVELGERKLSYEEYGNLNTLYKENYQLFVEYNIKDTELVEKLDNKLKLIDLALTIAYDSKTNYDDVFSQTRMWDQLIYTHLKENNVVIPPNENKIKSEAYIGAYVKEPIIGMHNWIASFDLTSLYPMIICQWNISPETLVQSHEHDSSMDRICGGVTVDKLLKREIDTELLKEKNISLSPNGHFYRNDVRGFMPIITDKMFLDRQAYKKKMLAAQQELENEKDESKRTQIENTIARFKNLQMTKKISLNSLYGAAGTPYFRYYDTRLATSITTSGQLIIKWIANDLNKYLNRILKTQNKDYVIASDTDSIYLRLDELVSKTIMEKNPSVGTSEVISFLDRVCETKIQQVIDKSAHDLAEYLNVHTQRMKMKREALANKGFWTAKKRYALNVYNNEGVSYSKPKIKVTGLEMIKSSTPSACRKVLWDSLKIIINKTEDDMIDFIEDFRQQFSTLPVSDIAFPRGVNNVEKYTRTQEKVPIHVRGSIVYNQALEKYGLTKKYQTIKDGEKIRFIYLKEPNVFHSNVIAFPLILPKELDLEKAIDYNLQFEKSFLEPLRIILKCIGWKTERTASLESFFS